MIIDNPESLKEWLTACLEPKCDADPAALARYVMALVKKDKPEKELKDICLDQLDVFLQKETKPFVDLLFETLNSKSYLRSNTASVAAVTTNLSNVITPSESTANGNALVVNSTTTVNGSSVGVSSNNGRTSSGGRTPQSSSSVPTSAPFKSDAKKKEGFSSETEGRERRHRTRSRSRSGSRSPAGRAVNRTRSHSRETDDRRGRRFSDDDRRRRIPLSRRFDNRYRDFRDRRVQDNANRDRSRERDRERDRDRETRAARERSGRDRTVPNERDRSRSRSRSGSWNRNRSRSRSGTWSPSPSRSRSRSRSRSWSRSRERSRERNRNEGHDSRAVSDAPQLTVDHGDTDYRLATGTTATPVSLVTTATTTTTATTESVSTLTPAVTPTQPTSVENNQFSAKTAKRCRDYDEMGYCMRGDLCPYDHGNDPVVVEDVSVLGFAPNAAAAAAPVTQASASSISSNTMHHIMPPIMGQSSPRPPLPTHPPPPPPPQPPQPEPYIPEPYNPEAPGLDRPPRVQPPFWTPSGPPPRPPSIRSSGPRGPHPPPPLSSVFHPSHPPRTRELIGVPTVDDARDISAGSTKISSNGRMVIEPHRPVMTMSGSQTNTTPSNTGLISSIGPQHLNHTNHTNDAGIKRRPFDYSRLGPKKQMNITNDRCTLELRKVPRHLNTIAELNSHFSKFGTIVNLQVCYEGDPEAALLQFSSHVEANSAYRSTEAVLNNRFVKMFWHNKDNNNTNQKQRQTPQPEDHNEGGGDNSVVKPSIKDRLSLQVNIAKTNTVSNTNQVTPSSNALEEITERTVVYSPIGNLSRTVFNPAVLKKTNVPSSILPRKTKEEHKKDSLKKKIEVQKKRQQLVQMHVQNHKLLVEKLEKCKNEKDKPDIKETLHMLAKKIGDLQSDIRKEAVEISQLSSASNHRTPRTKAECSKLKPVPIITEKEKCSQIAAEKELLDAEMDLYNKQHRGDDTTELRQKVHELRLQARALGLLDGSGRGRGVKSRRNINAVRGRGRGMLHHKLTSVDHRPRKIVVKGLNENEKDMILPHFLQFAEVENVEHNAAGTVVAFKTRRDAELAVSHGSKFNDRALALTWFKEHSTTASDVVTDLEGLDDDLAVDEEHHQPLLEVGEEDFLLADDEEEEDSEARSWRR